MAHADLVFSGESTLFSGPGEYSLGIFATATGTSEEIGSYNMTLNFSDPTFDFQGVTFDAPELEVTFSPPFTGETNVQVGATDGDMVAGGGLNIGLGETVRLVTVFFNATGPADASLTVDAVFDAEFGTLPFSVSPSAASLSVTAIPEPSSCVLMLGLAGLVVSRRRKR
ncbi:PEP-CTERM sorting domain-containing protein [Rhodopirellula sp. MGV]|uniref:PEP-CTERM sorting domain-containing protein n=1 Tax=Rhodopirellula sp. MGV TaxID=2023130 RepID=UPI001304026F|nr:PEP-CTERM sorting domain-containing protein [Rhodopirellula sp. MGV]